MIFIHKKIAIYFRIYSHKKMVTTNGFAFSNFELVCNL